MTYIRFEAASANEYGRRVGIFGLANGLARSGLLSPADWAWWRRNNDWFDRAYPDPATVDPGLFDKRKWPELSCWFADSATHLLARVPGYLELLDRYGLAWSRLACDDPGLIVYADPVQVVVAPHPTGQAAEPLSAPVGNN